MSLWKIIGLAGLVGFAGVAGTVIVRQRRSWHDVEPTELQRRLHERLEIARAEGRIPETAS
jgi:hypothetical protein